MSDLLLVYDLSVQEREITIGGTKYKLREASEDAASQYRNAAMRGAKMVDGAVTMGDAGNVQAVLVSACLFELDDKGQVLRNAPIAIIRTWPARVVKPLFDWVKEVSDLAEVKTSAENTRGVIPKN